MSQVVKRRLKIFQQHNLPGYQDLSSALIGGPSIARHAPLEAGNYSIIVPDRVLLVGKGQSCEDLPADLSCADEEL